MQNDNPPSQQPNIQASTGNNNPEGAKKGEGESVAEIYEKTINQMEDIRKQEEIHPLVSDKLDFAFLLLEYEGANNFLRKIKTLAPQYKLYRSLRRDGSCFYRAFMFRLYEKVIEGDDIVSVNKIEAAFRGAEVFMTENGFDQIVVEDFCGLVIETFDSCKNQLVTIPQLEEIFRDQSKSNYIVMFIRFLTSAYLQKNKELFAFYITEGLTIERFCRTRVETLHSDADNVQLMAVHNHFDIPMRIIYLDNSNSDKTHDLVLPDGHTLFWMNLLYRPGHYDLIYPSTHSPISPA